MTTKQFSEKGKALVVPMPKYSPRFNAFIPWILDHEGRYFEDDKDDLGGRTKFGIDQRSHPSVDIKKLTESKAIEIYWNEYWLKYGCENYPKPLGEVLFNACVNTGDGQAGKFLQRSKGDWRDFLDQMGEFYRGLVKSRPVNSKYLRGWLNRVDDMESWASKNS